ncbi:formate--tetrahydrofolate ligase [Pseudoalteromonas sp. 10-33]|uniref:formate--tetrahydrofolate ligase n=1 Tax=Pseudoalteromonas sp. 10-33 TaxID=1761890 RepID=UPI000A7A7A4B|nr:formate--tetrahydrofolate ligase [Pseudoalteromonas sp. 10-33]
MKNAQQDNDNYLHLSIDSHANLIDNHYQQGETLPCNGMNNLFLDPETTCGAR